MKYVTHKWVMNKNSFCNSVTKYLRVSYMNIVDYLVFTASSVTQERWEQRRVQSLINISLIRWYKKCCLLWSLAMWQRMYSFLVCLPVLKDLAQMDDKYTVYNCLENEFFQGTDIRCAVALLWVMVTAKVYQCAVGFPELQCLSSDVLTIWK